MPLSNVNPEQYQQQLAVKTERISNQFAEFNPPRIAVYDSPPSHYRVRAEFKVWHQGDDTFYAMFKSDQPKQPVRIEHFPIGSQHINRLMNALMQEIRQSELLRHKLFQIEFLTTISGQALVSFIYHKALDEKWAEIGRALQKRYDIKVIGRSRKQKMVLSDDFVIETLTVAGKRYCFQQVENSFTQPNAEVNQKMLNWALKNSSDIGGDLLELYCGNGNFTVVLAQNFDKVLATEISKTSVKSANENFTRNNIDNVSVLRMSSEDFTSALNGEREFRRLKEINLANYNFSTILVDPPRAGLDNKTEQLVSRFDNILYISCNPDTLYTNLQQIVKTHRVKHLAIFDQFPYTNHIECGVMLQKKT